MDLDREICLRFTPFAWLKEAWGAPVLVVVSFSFWIALFWMPWREYEIDWPAWVQAIGSLMGIGIAIWVPWSANRQTLKKEEALADELDRFKAMRLYTVIREALVAVKQLYLYGETFNKAVAEAEKANNAVRKHGYEPSPVPKGWAVRKKDTEFLGRIMHRALNNLDDDMCLERQILASKFRYDFSVLISQLESRVDEVPDGRVHGFVTLAFKQLRAHLDELRRLTPTLDTSDLKLPDDIP